MDPVSFVCNVCDRANLVPGEALTREAPTCGGCGSSVRIRAIVHLLSSHLFGRSLALRDFPFDRRVRGLGLSDWAGYAELLAQRLDYRNSFLDRGLRVDIVDPPEDLLGHFDFLIAADVFQHVPAPVQRAFDGARRLLRPGGLLLLTVPYDPGAPTVEHFDGLHELEVRGEAGQRRLHARAADGSAVVREDLVFHGGEGFTLEMRRFGLRDLLAHCRQAGFGPVAVQGEEVPERGIRWQPWSQPLIAKVPDDR